MKTASLFFLIAFSLGARSSAAVPPSCPLVLASLQGENIFELIEEYKKSEEARFKGFRFVTPVSEPDGLTGALLVFVDKGTNLRDRPVEFYGVPINYKETERKKSEGQTLKRIYSPIPGQTLKTMVKLFSAQLRNQKVNFDHLELQPTTQDGILALFVHFSSPDDFQNGQVEKAASLLSQFKEIIPIVLLVQHRSLYLYL